MYTMYEMYMYKLINNVYNISTIFSYDMHIQF